MCFGVVYSVLNAINDSFHALFSAIFAFISCVFKDIVLLTINDNSFNEKTIDAKGMSNASHNESQLICDSPLWDNDVFWWTTAPRLTDCFRQTILITIGPTLLLLLTPFDFRYFAYKRSTQSIPWRPRNVSSAVLNLVLVSISFWHLIRSVLKDVRFWSTVFEPSVDFTGLSLAYILQIYYRRNGRRISIALQVFWLITAIVSTIRLYLEFNLTDDTITDTAGHHLSYLIVYCVYISTSVVLLLLSNVCDDASDRHIITSNTHHTHYCPLENESALSRITFLWVLRFLRKGFKRRLQFKDFHRICHSIKTKYVSKLYHEFDVQYNGHRINRSLRPKSRRLLPVLWCLCYKSVLFCICLLVVYIPALYGQPYILNKLIDFLSDPNDLLWHGCVLAVGFAVLGVISTLIYGQTTALMENAALRCKSALISVIYRKMFRLSPTSRAQYTSGEIVTLMAVDCNEIFKFIEISMNLLMIPIIMCIGLYYLWHYLGLASLGFVAVMVFMIPINVFFGHILSRLQKNQMSFKDKRMAKISEILNSIKVIKLNAWEEVFIREVNQLRDLELRAQRKMATIYALIVLVWMMAPVVSASACFMAFAYLEYSKFTIKTIFVSLSIMKVLQMPIQRLPTAINGLIRAVVSLRRLSRYLSAEELDRPMVSKRKRDNAFSVCFENATFRYSKAGAAVLNDLTVNIKSGSLVGIIGEVGAGKSSLLSAIIGGLHKTGGNLRVKGSIAYVPQTPWIRNTSLKDNIIFMSDEDESRYQEVITACDLSPDLATLASGDRTVVGEGGITLSGGQRHRVSLARAIYQNCDIYLLDDPLSAVDAHVGQHLFQEVIGPKGLLRHKTRIMCLHNTSYLSICDQIIVLRDGEVVAHGNYSELSSLGLFSQTNSLENSGEESDNKHSFLVNSDNLYQTLLHKSSMNSESHDSVLQTASDEIIVASIESTEPTEPIVSDNEEVVYLGSVLWNDYYRYISSVGIILFVTIILFRFGSNGSEVAINYWLSLWSNHNHSEDTDSNDRKFNTIIYGSLLVSEAVFILLGNVVLFVATIRASRRLHLKAMYGVMRSPLSFFDRTPIGRLLNRFSRDISCVDESIPDLLISIVDVLAFFAILYGLVFYNFRYLSLGLLAIIALFYLIYRFYLKTSRQLRRMEAISNSPLQSHFCESIAGVDSITAYNVLPQFINESNKQIDLTNNCYYHRISLSLWLRNWCQIIGSFIITIIAIYIVCNRHHITIGLAALLIVYSVEAVANIAYTIIVMADLETNMISVERLREFSDLTPEKEWKSADTYRPSSDWPQNGCIQYIHYSTTYRNGHKNVLNDITFKIESGEKVAVVGRTGAGKSSLALSLFRMIEPICGQILIDGLNVSRIGLHDLRSKLTIIPQESTIFGNTIRMNLDPLGESTDRQLWAILDDLNLTSFVNSLPHKLDSIVTEKGQNLSAGQRQLICFGRALLRSTRIVVLDEATSACDLETDANIQKIIRQKLTDCTVISIVHRLDSILDYDKVLVMNCGSLAEYDSPERLLANTNSLFYGLAKQANVV